MNLAGPLPNTSVECERVLRSVPRWFGIEEALRGYVQDADRWPTFHALESGGSVGFITLRQHFPASWEIHCMAVLGERRGQGIGRRLHAYVERWLLTQGASFLQVKTLADLHPSTEYAETRAFYASLGYTPHEVFPTLWGAKLPVLQLVKTLVPSSGAA